MALPEPLIKWLVLVPGKLVRRYKRFLADIELTSGDIITAHCPNSGRMLQCSEPGRKVHISNSPSPSRRLACTWEIIEMNASPVVVKSCTYVEQGIAMFPDAVTDRGRKHLIEKRHL